MIRCTLSCLVHRGSPHLPVSTSHTRAVLSNELVTMWVPSVLNFSETISAVWPCERDAPLVRRCECGRSAYAHLERHQLFARLNIP
jgi:hypothetical protein